jgi:cell wall-associated NlpC family hydrolase
MKTQTLALIALVMCVLVVGEEIADSYSQISSNPTPSSDYNPSSEYPPNPSSGSEYFPSSSAPPSPSSSNYPSSESNPSSQASNDSQSYPSSETQSSSKHHSSKHHSSKHHSSKHHSSKHHSSKHHSSKKTSGAKIAAAAKAMVGKYRYSWGGGNINGATVGIKQNQSPYCDDRKVTGFDCSGLAMYAVYQGAAKKLDHDALTQYTSCPKHLPTNQAAEGDLLFYSTDKTSNNIHHVTIFVGNGNMVEAPAHYPNCTGMLVRETGVRTGELVPNVARWW